MNKLTIFPAIDIMCGNVVRLFKGNFDDYKVYYEDPLDAALHWIKQGAEALHIVDLDGARSGEPLNLHQVLRIRERCPDLLIEIGGGLRSEDTILKALTLGTDRVVISTSAFISQSCLDHYVKTFSAEKIAVSIDVRERKVALKGWQEASDLSVEEAVKMLKTAGICRLMVTDIVKDGTLTGLNEARVIEFLEKAADLNVIYAGGITALSDIQKLIDIKKKSPNLEGCISGKALYEGTLSLKEATELIKSY